MKVLFVVNPKAGGEDRAEIFASIRELVAARSHQAEFLLTTGKNDAAKVKEEIERFKPDRVAVGGGDGTVQLVAKILMPYDLPMGILPLGSANGLATALEMPKDPLDAAEKILDARNVRAMDVLRFNDKHICIHLSDIGVNALIVKRYEEEGERGMFGYAKYLLAAIKETPLYHITIRTTEETIVKEGYMMAFANAHKYGTGVQISEGSVSDGMFEICNVEKVSLDEAIKAGLTALNVFVDKDMFSDVITCRNAEITIDQKAHFQIDGEYMGMVDNIKIEVVPGAVKLLI
jgi:diacylglycerol kinase (ATP)